MRRDGAHNADGPLDKVHHSSVSSEGVRCLFLAHHVICQCSDFESGFEAKRTSSNQDRVGDMQCLSDVIVTECVVANRGAVHITARRDEPVRITQRNAGPQG